ncbi:cyclic nucleotide-binding domain-containing protein [Sphingobacterium paucimobilis]|uniref:Cyclic nucleotide-binding domain-containing protein n=1 Tax=Sphingobacterium paucimobilis HER1398 TaxID=1346330 RepID=U2HWY2_9SPHI|nr:Crp/Fnr family transcriptional regulator [Sphingobacterium paucimobilis]ERJ60027.1 hypothetical protein M472_14780 [Sphingobacterium paucimobilis HER1398]
MQSVFDYFQKYTDLSAEAKAYLTQHGKIHSGAKGSPYKLTQQQKNTWCFILSGMVVKEHLNHNGKPCIDRFSIAGDYFVGTRHAFTKRAESFTIVFAHETTYYEINNTAFQEAVNRFSCISYVYHIFKQHKLDQANDLAYIRSLHYMYRIHALYKRMPLLAALLTVEQRRLLLEIANNRDYYAAQRYYISKD